MDSPIVANSFVPFVSFISGSANCKMKSSKQVYNFFNIKRIKLKKLPFFQVFPNISGTPVVVLSIFPRFSRALKASLIVYEILVQSPILSLSTDL